MHTKVRNNIFFIVLALALVVVSPPIKAQRNYSIDQEQKKRKVKKPFFIKRWFMNSEERAVKRQVRKEKKKEDKIRANQQKDARRNQKRLNSNKQAGRNKTVYKRMKRYEKESKRIRKNKPKKNFFQRLFSKKH